MRIVIFTGAGLSAESGVPTFRDAGGLYDGTNVEDWLTAYHYRREPYRSRIDGWLDELRRRVASCEPNAAHRMIAEVCRIHDETLVMTQNIDDLLERAGVPVEKLLHLHGELRALRCRNRGHRVPIGHEHDPGQRCAECGARMRADVVLFHEPAPLYGRMWKEFEALRQEDLLIVIGTQGQVIEIGDVARNTRAAKILNNLHSSDRIEETVFDHTFLEPATTAAPKILGLVRERLAR
jgi:NAD-dependent deacetylase